MSLTGTADEPVHSHGQGPVQLPSMTGRWMLTPLQGRPYRSLAVVSVDLDTDTTTIHPPLSADTEQPEGVAAFVWFHGEPLGAFTAPGRPESVCGTLPEMARTVLERPMLDHLLRDALAEPGGLKAAREQGLTTVPHPEPVLDTRTVTVAVCTRDRPDELRGCLEAIRALRGPAAEILVVDNASKDERTRKVVDEFPGVRYVREPRQGLDWARNRALLEATGDIVAFTDDDVLVHPEWVNGIRRAFREEPAAVGVTGLVLPAELATQAQVYFEVVGGFGRGYRRKWFAAAVGAGEVAAQIYPGMGGAGTGANMALLREPALALGGFDPALDVGTPTGGGGDLEMFFRVIAAGHLLAYEPTAVVHHVHRTTMQQLIKQMRGHGTGSYSIFAGAARNYGDVQLAEFRRFAARWVYRRHLRGHARALLRPGRPVSLVQAETRGAFAAVASDLYGKAQRQAEAESARHPGEPTAPPLVHPVGNRNVPRTPDPVVTVDLDRDDLAGSGPGLTGPVAAAQVPADGRRRVRVLVRRDGRPEYAFSLRSGGVGASTVRLRYEIVDRMGPALLAPGVGWNHLHPADERYAARPLASAVERRVASPEPRLDPGVSVSVLMATRNRPDHLRRSLTALMEQDTTRLLQVVVVDNSADPTTTHQVAQPYAGSVTVVHEPRPGLSRARNAGAPMTTGEIVVFIDDDVIITPGWLENLVAPFLDPDVGAVTGNVVPANLDNLEAQIFEDYGGLGRGPHRRRFDRAWLQASKGAAPTWNIGATANAAFRRDVLIALGPWVEALGAGQPAGVGEDTEYFYRVLRAGLAIAYEPTAVVLHHHRDDRTALAAQLTAYSAGHVAYHLEVLARYRDLRGLRRIFGAVPRHQAKQVWRSRRRPLDDFPPDLIAAEVRGTLGGVSAWVRSRRSATLGG